LSVLAGKGHKGMIANENPPEQRPFNNLLRRLSASDFALIAPHLEPEVSIAN